MEKAKQADPVQKEQPASAAAAVKAALAEQAAMEAASCPYPRSADAASAAASQNSTASQNGTASGNDTASRNCGAASGSLPGVCAPLAFPYVPVQEQDPERYSRMEALETGTLFPGLNLPFKAAIQSRTRIANTALVELMALDFALQELGLYLTTHADDQEVLQLYWSYARLAKEGREKYQAQYGPLCQTDLTPEDGFVWLNDPWPWDVGGND